MIQAFYQALQTSISWERVSEIQYTTETICGCYYMHNIMLLDQSPRLHLHIILLCSHKSLRGRTLCTYSHAGHIILAARAEIQQCHASLHAVIFEIELDQNGQVSCAAVLQRTAYRIGPKSCEIRMPCLMCR